MENFNQLYEKFSQMVFNLALHYVQNKETAEEITQDVFISVYKSLETFRNDAQLNTWIYRVTINKSLDCIKAANRNKRFKFITDLLELEGKNYEKYNLHFDHPGIVMEDKEAIENIFKKINELPTNQKTALILSKLENKSQVEIAEIMELNIKAVESLVHRAKLSLAKKLN